MFQFETLFLQIAHLQLEILELITYEFFQFFVYLVSVVLGCCLHELRCFPVRLRHVIHHLFRQTKFSIMPYLVFETLGRGVEASYSSFTE